MRVAVVAFKGGVGKTTTAIHLAAYLQQKGKTLLLDGDPNHSAVEWAAAGMMPFQVATSASGIEYEHLVVDTEARPGQADLKVLADQCDVLVIPSTPDALSLRVLVKTADLLSGMKVNRYRVLLAIIPPRPSRDGDEAREMLVQRRIPVFGTGIRRLAAFQRAALTGVLVRDVPDVRAPLGWADYDSVGKELLHGKI